MGCLERQQLVSVLRTWHCQNHLNRAIDRSSQLVLSCFWDHLFLHSLTHSFIHAQIHMIIALAPFGNCGHREGPQDCTLDGDREKTEESKNGNFHFLSLKGVLHQAYEAGTGMHAGVNKGFPGGCMTWGSGWKRQAVCQPSCVPASCVPAYLACGWSREDLRGGHGC